MNAIKLFLLSFKKNIFSYILVILEVVALIIAENYMICTLNERKMLHKAYYPLLGENSVLAIDMQEPFFARSRDNILKDLPQDCKIYNTVYWGNNELEIISVSDEIYEKLAMPLSSGSYGNVENSAVGTVDIKPGNKTIRFDDGTSLTLNVSGILTDMTYIPMMAEIGSGMTVNDFYISREGAAKTIITSRSAIKGYEKNFLHMGGIIIEFKSDFERGTQTLRENGASITPARSIVEKSDADLAEDKAKFLPLTAAIAVVVLTGIICISIITFKENERRNGVLWLSGYSRLGIISVHSMGIALITIMSVGISLAAFAVMRSIGSELVTGITLSIGNFIATIITCLALTLFSALVPAIKSRKTSPVEYFRRTL